MTARHARKECEGGQQRAASGAGELPEAVLTRPPEVRAFGRQLFDPVWAERDHVTPDACELLHVISGQMDLVIGERRYHVGPGDTAIVPRGVRHRDDFDTAEGLDILFCSFTWPGAEAFFTRVSNETLQTMSNDRRTQLVAMFEQVRAEPPGTTPAGRALLRTRLLAILLFILHQADEPNTQSTSASRRLMLRAKQYIHANYAECVALADIAAALGVSPYHLSHVFSHESDFSLFGYLMQVRMTEAKELLRTGRCNVAEVSRAVGYQDPNYFSKAFRKHVGMSPTAYAASGP